jgi:hypothetical protein
MTNQRGGERVETEPQLALLCGLGCELAQGGLSRVRVTMRKSAR